MVGFLLKGDRDAAVNEATKLATYYAKRDDEIGLGPYKAWDSIDVKLAGYYLCILAQLHALRRDQSSVRDYLARADAWAERRSDFVLVPPDGMGSIAWREIVFPTRGLASETAGAYDDAVAAYKKGAEEYGVECVGRMAMVALAKRDTQSARSRIADARPAEDCASWVARALLAEGDGAMDVARDAYQSAMDMMTRRANEGSQWLPICWTERDRVVNALARLKKP